MVVNQYEDFESFQHVTYVLGEFVIVNAVFSFATDMCAQKLEGKWFCCQPVAEDSELDAEEMAAKAKDGVAAGPAAAASEEHQDAAAANTAADPELAMRVAAPEQWDASRSCRFACTGVFFCGVMQFIRLAIIDIVFDKKDTSMKAAIWKTVVNQAVFSPIVRAWSMMTVRFMYERARGKDYSDSWSGACANLQEKFCEAQGVSYMVKPLSNFLAFALCPTNILGQAIIMRSVAFVYNVYFDFLVHAEEAKEKQLEEGGEEGAEGAEGEEGVEKKDPKVDRASKGCVCCQACTIM